MKFLELLVASLNPYGVYQSSQNMATNVFLFLTPFLLVIAVAIRTLETQLDTVSGVGKWEKAIRDFILFGFLIGSYFGVMTLLNLFMNEVYLLTNDFGNYQTLSKKLETLMDISLGLKQTDAEWLTKLKGLDTTPHGLVIFLIYRVSNIFVVTTYVFLQAAHALSYSFALIMGLIVLPMAITQKLNVLKGWGLVLGTAFLWPIVESLFMGLTGDMFIKAVQAMLDEQAKLGLGLEDKAEIRAFFATVNFVLGMIMITAPIVTGAVLAGGNAMFPMVAPFAAGSMALAGTALASGRSIMRGGGATLSAAGALGGMMGLTKGGAGLSGSLPGGGSGPSSYGGGPQSRGGGGSSGSSGGSSGASSGGSSRASSGPLPGGASGTTAAQAISGGGEESHLGPKSEEAREAEQRAAEKKRKKGRTGHFVNLNSKKKAT